METRLIVKPKRPKTHNKIAERIYTLHKGIVDHHIYYPKAPRIQRTELYPLYPHDIPASYTKLMHLICRYTGTKGKIVRRVVNDVPHPVKTVFLVGGYKDLLMAGYFCQMVFEHIRLASDRRSLILKRRAKQERVRVNRGTLDPTKRRYTEHTNRAATKWKKEFIKSTEDIFRELLKDTEEIYPEAFLIIKNKLRILRNELNKTQWKRLDH